MEDRIIQFRVGVVVIAACLIGGTLALWFGEGIRHTYTIYLKYPSAPGVAVDTPVRKSGIRIGRVTQVDLLDDGVLLTAKIDEGRALRTSEEARIATASLLGDAVVEFVLRKTEDLPQEIRVIRPGETLVGKASTGGPMEVMEMFANLEDDIDEMLGSVADAGNKVADVSVSINELLSTKDEHLQSIVGKTDQALTQFNQTMSHVNDIIGDDKVKGELKKTLASLPTVLADAKKTLVAAKTTFARFSRVGEAAERNLSNLEGITQPLGESGPELVAQLQSSVANIEELAVQLTAFSKSLNHSKGSLGQFVNNPELFERLNMAAENIESATRKVMPLMNDARVLMDKLARDPSQLGIRGAISRQPSGSGLKFPLLGPSGALP